ncbi:phospholipase A2 group XV [Nematostella vectensis]|uniref:phospholipase A2 group XV n=1 Tax=Nematostella vectensis TaxID=45351 RepID=UPI0020779320|nr:phospholipase A2 group XV [Nematostella vectensis]
MLLKTSILFTLSYLLLASLVSKTYCKPPILLVPGDGGSRLDAKLNKTTAPHYVCKRINDWFHIWLSLEELLPEVIDCWSDNMRLVYDEKHKRMTSPPGVQIRVPDFGKTSSVAYLDPTIDHPGEYFAPLIDALVSIGYTKDKNLRAAPFDFRYAPDSAGEFYAYFQALVEQMFMEGGGEPVLVVSHSLGVPYTKYFLDRIHQEWKDKYLHAWVTIGGAWGGAAKLFRIISSGTNLGFPDFILNPLKMRVGLRTYESTTFLLPSEKFWDVKEPVIFTPKKNYSLSNFEEFLDDLNFPLGKTIKGLVPPVWSDHPPNVTLYCLYGTGVPTPRTFEFKEGQFPDTYPKTNFGDGDGTVNRKSLEGCFQYEKTQKRPVVTRQFPKAEHMAIIGDKRVTDFIKGLVEGLP